MKNSVESSQYLNSVKVVATTLGIEEEKLHFIIDIFTRDPHRIFRFEDEKPLIDPKFLTFSGDIPKQRLNMLSEAIVMKAENVKRAAALWTYSQDMISFPNIKPEKDPRQTTMRRLAKDVLGIDEQFLNILMTLKQSLEQGKMTQDFKEYLSEFISTLSEQRAAIFPFHTKEEMTSDITSKIWNWDDPKHGSFMSIYKDELTKLDRDIQNKMNRVIDLPPKDLDKIFEISSILSQLIVQKDEDYFRSIFGIENNSNLLEGLSQLFDLSNIDCVMTLSIIDKSINARFGNKNTIRKNFIPGMILFNKSTMKDTLMKLPPKSSLFANFTSHLKK